MKTALFFAMSLGSLVTSKIPRVAAFVSRSSPVGCRRLSKVSVPPQSTSKLSNNLRSSPRQAYTWLLSGLMVASSGTFPLAYCQEDDFSTSAIQVPPFDDSVLTFDHYNGVTLHLDKIDADAMSQFQSHLQQALTFWKAEGRKGIWIHAATSQAHLIPHCVEQGFNFHFVKEQTLVLSQWLLEDVPSRLPFGPTHQVGVGAVVFHPSDASQMLVVQEKSGPAAAYQLWKMPTGLLDPGEDIPDAAARELLEETGLEAAMDGIVCFRQAHSESRTSDLFFVCRMKLKDPSAQWKMQEEEIADIRWMKVEDYCNQDRWQGSPLYEALNESILKASLVAQKEVGESPKGMISHEQLPLGFAKGTNALFRSQL